MGLTYSAIPIANFATRKSNTMGHKVHDVDLTSTEHPRQLSDAPGGRGPKDGAQSHTLRSGAFGSDGSNSGVTSKFQTANSALANASTGDSQPDGNSRRTPNRPVAEKKQPPLTPDFANSKAAAQTNPADTRTATAPSYAKRSNSDAEPTAHQNRKS